jgi:hypothetical protein
VGHKSPEYNALVEAGISQDLDAIFDDDVTVDSFLKAFQEDPGLSMRNHPNQGIAEAAPT